MSATSAPEVSGSVARGYEQVAEVFAANFEERGEVGAACCVYRDGAPVVDLWAGLADRGTARPWTRDTIVITFSCTKGVTAVAANQLVERGKLDPDAPVASYWPEFAAQGKERIPVAWVLSHRAGLAAIDSPDLTLDDVAAWEPVVEAIAAQAPNWEPGTAHGYHARTYGWITGELIRRVTGRMPGAYVNEEIARPLGLDFFIGVPESQDHRVATLYPPTYDDPHLARLADEVLHDTSTLLGRVMGGPSGLFGYDDMWNTRRMRAAQLPSTNGHGDARVLARMYAACLGEVDGVRLLEPATIARATQVRSSGTDCVLGRPLSFGLGFALDPTFGPVPGPAAFGHSGAGGSVAFADPEVGLSFAYVMNQMRLSTSEQDPRSQSLIRATYDACERARS